MREDLIVQVEKLRRVYNPESFQFENTNEVRPAEGFIGQEKAVQALDMALGMDSPEYNPFIVDSTGISRKSVLLKYLEKTVAEKMAAAGGKPDLRDFCCIFNFEKPDQPKILIFDMGKGKKFKKDMENLLKALQKRIPLVLKSEMFIKTKDQILSELEEVERTNFQRVEKEIIETGCFLWRTPQGLMVVPASRIATQSEPMPDTEYKKLSEAEKNNFEENIKIHRKNLEKVFKNSMEDQKKTQQKIEALEREYTEKVLKSAFKTILREQSHYPEVLVFLEKLKEYVMNNVNFFKEDYENKPNGFDPFLPLAVNLFLDNSGTEKIPIVFEDNPTFTNLFGEIQKNFVHGVVLRDHTKIRAGSLLAADGGYLVLNARDVLRDIVIWEKLERTIRRGFLKIEDPMNYFGFAASSLSPEPIAVRLKVILVGPPLLYDLLVQYDPEFSAICKIKVELDNEMPSNQDNEMAYAAFIALCCQKEDSRREKDGLLPFDRSAVAKVIEHGLRLADKQTKLSTEFSKIKELIVEADYWAGKVGSGIVTAEHVKKALDAQRLRANLMETKFREFIKDEMLLLNTEGEKVGQINGLSVYVLGDYSFGIPSRITAQTFLGQRGVVSIDREVKMSGPIHNKGVLIFLGYFGKKYGSEKPISFSASICFEQSYGGIEGDSASAAELFCVISSLSELPTQQNIAVTGSVNQKGEIQPIGGVNQKIEGFFDVCKERGLTGNQGVIIPHQNVKNLMLREDVVEACREGKFRVYAIKTVDEGLELLMGASASEIHQKVITRLSEMTQKIQKKDAPNAS